MRGRATQAIRSSARNQLANALAGAASTTRQAAAISPGAVPGGPPIARNSPNARSAARTAAAPRTASAVPISRSRQAGSAAARRITGASSPASASGAKSPASENR
jgi:hypothetical protein